MMPSQITMIKALAFQNIQEINPGIHLLTSEEEANSRCEIETTLKPMQNMNQEETPSPYQVWEHAESKVVTRLHSEENVNIAYAVPVGVEKTSARSTPQYLTMEELVYGIRYVPNANLMSTELQSTG